MIGTITNACAILAGTAVGCLAKRGIGERYQKVMFDAMGLASLALGVSAACQALPRSQYPVLFILSLAIGGVAGTALDIDGRLKGLVDRLQGGTADGRPRLAEGLTTAVLLYCIGTLSILGPVRSALTGDNTWLYTNATLDGVSSAVFAATYGPGIALAAVVLFVWQGAFYLLATLCGDVISDSLMTEMSIVGGILIVASGLAILKVKDCRTLNMIPALAVPGLYFLIKAAC